MCLIVYVKLLWKVQKVVQKCQCFYSVLNYSCCPQAPDAQGSLACLSQAGEVV